MNLCPVVMTPAGPCAMSPFGPLPVCMTPMGPAVGTPFGPALVIRGPAGPVVSLGGMGMMGGPMMGGPMMGGGMMPGMASGNHPPRQFFLLGFFFLSGFS